jgi:predicted RecB family nuclease
MILLGSYAAKRCPVRTHNDFAPLVPVPDLEPSAELQADFDAANEFEADVFSELFRINPAAVLLDPGMRKGEAVAITQAAMESGAPLILGGWLPDDEPGGRKGRPDILIKVHAGYLPADIKHHKTIKSAKKKRTLVSSLSEPADWRDTEGLSTTSHYYEDGLQLAHYTRMLQACGFHPGEDRLSGAILGTSMLELPGADTELVFVWHDLTTPVRDTFSRSKGKVRRSLLERYDHEHRFRAKVAATAARIVGSVDDPEPLVVPIGQEECERCPYERWCAEQMGPEDPSAAITRGRLDTREWQTLRRMGLSTTAALADLDPEAPDFFEEYYPEVIHQTRDKALKRLIGAVQQARMICAGIDIEPIVDVVVEVPIADVEIDFDIEWDKAGRIYQWGLRVRDGQDDSTASYEPIVSFESLDDEGELQLAETFADRITQLRTEAATTGRTVAVYHWSHVEVSNTRKFACVAAALGGVTFDLLPWFTGAFHVRGKASIKAVAQLFGFSWAVEDPGGRLSQEKIDIARAGGAAGLEAQEWCLRYNESDVAAQAVIRDGLRVMFTSGEPADLPA